MDKEKPPTNYRKLTIAQLKNELLSRKLEVTGKKQQLIDRLNEHDRLLQG